MSKNETEDTSDVGNARYTKYFRFEVYDTCGMIYVLYRKLQAKIHQVHEICYVRDKRYT